MLFNMIIVPIAYFLMVVFPFQGTDLVETGTFYGQTNEFDESVIFTVDYFEGKMVSLLQRDDEERKLIIDKTLLSDQLKEGDLLRITFGLNHSIVKVERLDKETTLARQKARELLEKLIRKCP